MTILGDSRISSARRLWVVMFDSLELPDPDAKSPGDENVDDSSLLFNAFDDLEVRSTYFEQYVLQSVKAKATECDRLGGRDHIQMLAESSTLAKRSMAVVRLRIAGADWKEASGDNVGSVAEVLASSGARQFETVVDGHPSQIPLADQDRSHISAADLAWFCVEVNATDQARHFREHALSAILAWHQSFLPDVRPALIVTALRGTSQVLTMPLESRVDEGEIRVPLWIDAGRNHAKRVQSVAGNFDLPQTIADLLGCPMLTSEQTSSGEFSSERGDSRDVTRSLSLLPLCGHGTQPFAQGTPVDASSTRERYELRILPLAGDGWTGLRSLQYQLITQELPKDDNQTFKADETRQLFLKPDDFWNVSDAIISYEAIADEMESQSSSNSRPAEK